MTLGTGDTSTGRSHEQTGQRIEGVSKVCLNNETGGYAGNRLARRVHVRPRASTRLWGPISPAIITFDYLVSLVNDFHCFNNTGR